MELLNNFYIMKLEGILLLVILVIGLIKHFFFTSKTYKLRIIFNVIHFYYSKDLKIDLLYLILLSILIMFRLNILYLVVTLIVVGIINFKIKIIKSESPDNSDL